jgi:hypothetical protein
VYRPATTGGVSTGHAVKPSPGIIHDCQAPSAMRTLWIFGTWQWARRLLSLRLPHNKSVGPAERPGRLTKLCGGIVDHPHHMEPGPNEQAASLCAGSTQNVPVRPSCAPNWGTGRRLLDFTSAPSRS